MLDAPLVYSTVSRLIIDCNRALDAPDLIATVSETTSSSGQCIAYRRRAPAADRSVPRAIPPRHRRVIERASRLGAPTALIAIHSFTRVYRGVARPWEASLIFDRNRRLADILIDGLVGDGLNVGVNEPYSPADRVYYTLSRHAEARGLDCAMIEIRNDLVRIGARRTEWAERIAGILSPAVVGERSRAAVG